MDEVAEATPKSRPWLEVGMYATVAVVSIVVAFGLLGFWGTPLNVPLRYQADAVAVQAGVKGMIETGWLTHNPYLGAPGQLSSTSFPTTEMLQLLLVKLMTLFTHDVGLIVNLFFLLTYPLVALSALAVLRVFGVSRPVAVTGAMLYTFMPFHQLRGELHLMFSAYFMVPLAIMVALWVWSDRQPVFAQVTDGEAAGRWRFTLADKRTIAALVICLAVGLGGVYYAAFALFFIAGSAVITALGDRDARRLVGPAILIATVFLGVIIALSPYLLAPNRSQLGSVAKRSSAETTIYGLKVADLLLPVRDHRLSFVAAVRDKFQADLHQVSWVLDNETQDAALGVVGSVGLIFLLFWLPIAAWKGWTERFANGRRYTELSALMWWGILLGSAGGLGTLIAVLVSAQIRAYNRISIFLAFFALFAVCLLLDTWFSSMEPKSKLPWLLSIAIIGVGLFDQTTAPLPDYRRAVIAQYSDDISFMGRVESALPPGTSVFQMPFVPYPEGNSTRLSDYEHLRGYLHSNSLRYSYGAVRGTADAGWDERTSHLPVKEMIAQLKSRGFGAIWVDRRGYDDAAQQTLVTDLAAVLGPPIALDAGNARVVWKLNP